MIFGGRGVSGETVPKPVLIEHSCTSLNINWQLISPPSPQVEYILNISFKRERESKCGMK